MEMIANELVLLNKMYMDTFENYEEIQNGWKILDLKLSLKTNDKIEVIKGHENYAISEKGNVYNLKTKRKLIPSMTGFLHRPYYGLILNGKCVKIHTLIGKTFIENPNNSPCIDHINGNSLDNSIENLRWVTYRQNGMNKSKNIIGTSNYKGVSIHKKSGKYQTFICINGKNKFIGLFETEEEAARKYDEAAILNYGEFAKLNF